MKRLPHTPGMALCTARSSATLWLHVETIVEAHEMIWNFNREKPHQPITFSFVTRIHSEYSNQMLISGEMVFQVVLAVLQ